MNARCRLWGFLSGGRFALVAFGLLLGGTMLATGDDKKPDTLELGFPTTLVPADLKAGQIVNLQMVLSATISSRGQASYSTSLVVGGLTVVQVERPEKPADPDQAVRVTLRVTPEQAKRIEVIRARKVTVHENDPQTGRRETKEKPVPLMLELAKS